MPIPAPPYATSDKLKKLFELATTDVAFSQYFDGNAAKVLIAEMVSSFRNSLQSERWNEDPILREVAKRGEQLGLFLSCAFDVVSNAEYCHGSKPVEKAKKGKAKGASAGASRGGRLTNSNWIYCSSEKAGIAASFPARVFYSFLKQCPHCSFYHGLESRLSGAQHKPSSHHIGEITTSLMAMLLQVLIEGAAQSLSVAVIDDQNHDVDAMLFSDEMCVLLETKASSLVTFPIGCDLPMPLQREVDGEVVEYDQHSLVDFLFADKDLYLYVPHAPEGKDRIPLGMVDGENWPYPPLVAHFSDPDRLLDFLSSWIELYRAFAVPKTERTGRNVKLGYLTNGWGDEIDSNKTKPGLGRTDDLKKGTYQMLKYGAYYKEEAGPSVLFSALLANMDPVNFWKEYLSKLIDVRWTRQGNLHDISAVSDAAGISGIGDKVWAVGDEHLFYLYESIVAFNHIRVNEPRLVELFSLDVAFGRLEGGKLDSLLASWRS
jgi:hypothetical protein